MRVKNAVCEYSAVVLSSPRAVHELVQTTKQLLPDYRCELDPGFFVGSLSSDWIPRVVRVSRGREVAGWVYAKEKALGGIPTGVVYGEGSLGNMVFARPGDERAVLGAALGCLLDSGLQGLRLLIPPAGYEMQVLRESAASRGLPVTFAPALLHAQLQFAGSYNDFLSTLSHRTRRNFRYYRKQFELQGHSYVPLLSNAELIAAANNLRAKCRIHSSKTALDRIMSWVLTVERPFACGLRSRSGEWLGVAVGYYDRNSATMLLQLNNDLEHDRGSLSIVLRGYLIESLIREGRGELIFWAGVGGALSRYASSIPGTRVYVDSPSLGWRMIRSLIQKVGPNLPSRLQKDLAWITPFDFPETQDGASDSECGEHAG